MLDQYLIAFFLVLSCLMMVLDASFGDADPHYRSCVNQCEETGCVGQRCFPNCNFSSEGVVIGHPWYTQEPLYLQWKKLDCLGNCRYYCMLDREKKRELLGYGPVKYHGKWPFRRIYGMQEPASVAFSAFNLVMHFYGWLSFINLLYHNLPLKDGKRPFYEFTALWHIYGILSLNSWLWSTVFHTRNVYLTEEMDYSSAAALLGYSLMLSILRSFNIRDEATRGWNTKVCVAMAVAQLTTWAVWAGVTRHPSRRKLRLVVIASGLAMLLEMYDFPPYEGLLDARALRHATTIPLTYLWWSFVRDDARIRTSNLLKETK